LLHCFHAKRALLPCQELRVLPCIDSGLPSGGQNHALEIRPWGHDPRQVDLVAILALLIIIVAACRIYSDSNSGTPSHTAFIVPSQTVRW